MIERDIWREILPSYMFGYFWKMAVIVCGGICNIIHPTLTS
jgi:hypothetical protein